MGSRREDQRSVGTITRSKTIDPKKNEEAARLVATKGRAYQRGNYLTVRVYARYQMELYKLVDVYGGGIYKHRRTGYVWALGKKANIRRLAREARQYLPRDHKLGLLYQSSNLPAAEC